MVIQEEIVKLRSCTAYPITRLALVANVLAFGTVGCDVQRGRFSATGDSSLAFTSHVGCIHILSGRPNQPFNAVHSPQQNLLYLLIVCPAAQATASSSRGEYGKYTTTLTHNWDTQTGPISVSVTWDRQADTVTAAGKTFVRANGNVLVIRREPSGNIISQQLHSIGPYADFQQVLQHAQKQLPNDGLVASLRLAEK